MYNLKYLKLKLFQHLLIQNRVSQDWPYDGISVLYSHMRIQWEVSHLQAQQRALTRTKSTSILWSWISQPPEGCSVCCWAADILRSGSLSRLKTGSGDPLHSFLNPLNTSTAATVIFTYTWTLRQHHALRSLSRLVPGFLSTVNISSSFSLFSSATLHILSLYHSPKWLLRAHSIPGHRKGEEAFPLRTVPEVSHTLSLICCQELRPWSAPHCKRVIETELFFPSRPCQPNWEVLQRMEEKKYQKTTSRPLPQWCVSIVICSHQEICY